MKSLTPARMSAPMLEVRDLKKSYGSLSVVDGVSFRVDQGEIVTLLGPSGCGKTSTLRMIAGFLKPDSGQVILKGEVINKVAPFERDVEFVFQNYALFPHMTVAQNVAFGLRMRRVPTNAQRSDRVREALALVNLEGYERRYPNELSGGQQQRVAIARTLVTEPSILLMDEPMSNLDAALRVRMQLELRAIIQRVGLTTVLVTHNQEEALSMSDRMVVMFQGKIAQIGTPIEIYSRPRNEAVASFLGRSNIIACRVKRTASGITSVETTAGTELVAMNLDVAPGKSTTLFVRPEVIELSSAATKRTNSIGGVVRQVAYTGVFFEYLVEADGIQFLVRVVAQRHTPLTITTQVWLSWLPEDAVSIKAARQATEFSA